MDDPVRTFHWPAEHGAWGILIVPFVCAAGISRTWNAPVALCGVAAMSLFLLRGSLENKISAQAAGSAGRTMWRLLLAPAHLVLAACAVISAILLVAYFERYELLFVGLAAAGVYGLQKWLALRERPQSAERRSLLAELAGMVLLTLSAPAAWIAARGSLFERSGDANLGAARGIHVWLLNLLFFFGGILYVKYRVRGLSAHRAFRGLGERFHFALPVLLYYLFVVIFLILWLTQNVSGPLDRIAPRGWGVVLAFTPGVLRASSLLFALGRRFPIRRLGWMEMIHAAWFAGFVIFAFRG